MHFFRIFSRSDILMRRTFYPALLFTLYKIPYLIYFLFIRFVYAAHEYDTYHCHY